MATYLESNSDEERRRYDPLGYWSARAQKAEKRIVELETRLATYEDEHKENILLMETIEELKAHVKRLKNPRVHDVTDLYESGPKEE